MTGEGREQVKETAGGSVQLKAHAKLNLGLSLLGRRSDGFHDLDTLMVRLGVCDLLTLTPGGAGVQLEVTGLELGISPEDNLVYRAAARYLSALPVSPKPRGVVIELEKRLPVAAGLGGGSSDAGATLRALAQLFPAGLELLPLAADLGSDVPFFVLNTPAAWATRRGEQLTPLTLPPLHVVLANPGAAVSAREAYGYVRRFSGPLNAERLIAGLTEGDPDYPNDLEAGVVAHYPVVGEVLEALKAADLRGVRMSGSGSSCFGLAKSAEDAESVAATLAEVYPTWWIRATTTL